MAYPFAKVSAPRSSNDYAMEPVSSGGGGGDAWLWPERPDELVYFSGGTEEAELSACRFYKRERRATCRSQDEM
jgi:hypothetical protein